ncbi:hypothetical protein C8A05DRAFT_32056 [Staphylotrichum tortipilum]|uniref:Uncharacterized protein n=1 Tax=Staphylotrichum tortipilum TaxID=2831512 RepID=A0AAN6MPR2_9PEZI|nr:hypothetical protein C8A05DRAFT_32056 [Staphylotrichum longicolle]
MKSKVKAAERDDLLSAILQSASTVTSPCSSCKTRGLVCKVSPAVSSACYACVRNHQSFCDAQGISAQQLRKIVAQHGKVESELEKAEAELLASVAKVNRLRSQKRMWFDKMTRAISRGIDTVEELERVEREESEALAAAKASGRAPSSEVCCSLGHVAGAIARQLPMTPHAFFAPIPDPAEYATSWPAFRAAAAARNLTLSAGMNKGFVADARL